MRFFSRAGFRSISALTIGTGFCFWQIAACSTPPQATNSDPDAGGTEDPGDRQPAPTDEGPITIGDPNLADAGPLIDQSCVGVKCTGNNVCSDGQCVPNNRDLDGDGYTAQTDCNDNDPLIHPGATEICNNKDDNCDKVIDEGFDQDGDGFYQCAHGTKAVDCDDTNPAKNPAIAGKPVTDYLFNTTPQDPHWNLLGSTQVSNSWARLSSTTDHSATGALWWKADYSFDKFVVYTTFWLLAGSTAGQGMAFAWVPGSALAVGQGGNGLGFQGLGGYAVAIDTHQDPGEPVAPFVALLDSKGVRLKTAPIPSTVDLFDDHTLNIIFDKGKITVRIDKVDYITDYVISGYKPFLGHWGFTSATGTGGEAHFLSSVTMIFPNGQACVP